MAARATGDVRALAVVQLCGWLAGGATFVAGSAAVDMAGASHERYDTSLVVIAGPAAAMVVTVAVIVLWS